MERLIHAVLRVDAKVAHISFGHIGVQLLPFIAASPRPEVVSFHGAGVRGDALRPTWRVALKRVFERSALILGRSESLLDGLEKLGFPQQKLRLQRTGVPLDACP